MTLANELRAGNLLKLEGRWVVVDGQAIRDISIISGEAGRYERIPLTSEVLTRCGFRDDSLRVSNDVGWAFNLELVKGEMVLAVEDYALPVGCRFLHHLQNLFYAITGEELNVSTKGIL
jgi:hypothetical protein